MSLISMTIPTLLYLLATPPYILPYQSSLLSFIIVLTTISPLDLLYQPDH